MSRLTAIRLAAVLLPGSLLLHEGVYALAGGIDRSAHDYFTLLVPIIVAGAASLAVAALLLPALGFRRGGDRVHSRPFAIALGLIALFVVQEGAEAVIFGGGAEQLAAALTASWALLPLAFVFGVFGAGAIELLERAGAGLARLLGQHRPRPVRPPRAPRPAIFNPVTSPASSPLAFGLASRPPPLSA